MNREQEDNQDHKTSAPPSGIPRDSTGKEVDVGMKSDGATRNAKRPIGEDDQTEEREKKVLVAAPEQGTKISRGPEDADRGGVRNKMNTDLNQMDQEGTEKDIKSEVLMRKT